MSDSFADFNSFHMAWPGPRGDRWRCWHLWTTMGTKDRAAAVRTAPKRRTKVTAEQHLARHRPPLDRAAMRAASDAFHRPIDFEGGHPQATPAPERGTKHPEPLTPFRKVPA